METDPVEYGHLRLGRYLVGGHRVGDWIVTLVLASVAGESGICEVHVEPFRPSPKGDFDDRTSWATRTADRFRHLAKAAAPAQTLTVAGLRGLPLGALAAAHWESERLTTEMSDAHAGASAVVGLPAVWSLDISDMPGDQLRALTARRYADLVQSGHPRPLQQLAGEFDVSVSAIRARIARARADGFLTQARNGVAAGEFTDIGEAHLGVLRSKTGVNHGERAKTEKRKVARKVSRT